MTRVPRLRPFALAAALALVSAWPAMPAGARPATEVCEVSVDTTWVAAGSPFLTTCSVSVPAGVTLRLEPGVTVRLGPGHSLQVAGRLLALGSPEAPIAFEAATESQAWGGVQLAAGSGPSEIAHARFSGGGARRAEMLGIATGEALVRNSEFGKGTGVAIEVRGASPTIRDNRFVEAAGPSTDPAAALRILGASDPVVAGNYFQSNSIYGVSMEANANPRFSGNRFLYNGFDGVLVYGNARRDVRWPSLGPRGWAYQLTRSQVVVENGASLEIGAGATVKFAAGVGMRVNGTLLVRGEAGRQVLFTSGVAVPRPGSWREVWLAADSTDYDEASGQGSRIDHAIFEYGGSQPNGQLWIQGSSPRVSNSVFRRSGQKGLVVSGNDARPSLVGLSFVDNTAEQSGIGLGVSGGAAPSLSWSVFRNNRVGVRSESLGSPRIGPHNRFEAQLAYALFNEDSDVCVDATGNDWGAPNGPLDGSARSDACDQGRNDGAGNLVSDHVRYGPWEGQVLPRPVITAPRCGLAASDHPSLSGLAPAGSRVEVYDNQTLLGEAAVEAGSGEVPWSFTPQAGLAPGSHVLQARALRGEEASAPSDALALFVDPGQLIQPAGIDVTYTLDGTRFTQPYQDAAGCLTLSGEGDWPIRPLSGAPITLRLPVSCPGGATATGAAVYNGAEHPFTPGVDGRLEATFDQAQGGALGLHVACGTVEKDLLLGTVSPEFNGFVYDAGKGVLDRVVGAQVTLFVREPGTGQWVPWQGTAYHGQANPVVTGMAGRFAFYPQPGLYRVRVLANGFEPTFGEQIEVTVNPYVANVGLVRPSRPAIYLPVARRD